MTSIIGFISVLIIILMPSDLAGFSSSFDNARLLEILVSLIAASALIFAPFRRFAYELLGAQPTVLYATLGAGVAGSIFFSTHHLQAMLDAGLNVLLIVYLFAVAYFVSIARDLADKLFIGSFVAAIAIFVLLFCIAYWACIQVGSTFPWYSPFVSFPNARFFSQYQAYALPLLVLPVTTCDLPKRWRVGGVLILTFAWALNFAAGSRSIWASLLATVLFLQIFLKVEARPWLKLQGLGFALGGALYLLFSHVTQPTEVYGLSSMAERGTQANGRWQLWGLAVSLIQQNPVFGIGPLHFAYLDAGKLLLENSAHPHNSFLTFAVEYGLPVALLLIFLLIKLLVFAARTCRTADIRHRKINIALTAGLICGITESFFSGNLNLPYGQVCFTILAGWLIGRNKMPIQRVAKPSWFARCLLLSVVIGAAALQVNEVMRYYTVMEASGYSFPEYAYPRFWQDGHRL